MIDRYGNLVVGTDKKVNKAVSVEKGFKDGTTVVEGNIVSAKQTVGQNLTAFRYGVAANKQAISKAKVDTALHVDKDGKLVVGTDKKSQ